MNDLWWLLQEIRDTGFQARLKFMEGRRPLKAVLEEMGIAPRIAGEFIYCAENYHPDALSVEHYMMRNCYYEPHVIASNLRLMQECGLVAEKDDGQFGITEKGHQFRARFYEVANPSWAFPTLSDSEMARILALLRRVAKAMKAVPHWSIATRAKYGLKVPDGLHPMMQLDAEVIFDLWAFRDDAHLAAWKSHNIAPRTWEAFTYLWNGKADSAETLVEVLLDHGFGLAEYTLSLGELAQRRWVTEEAGKYRLTDEGKRVRDEAERVTDEIFYAPWSCLSEDEITELRGLLMRLRDKLKELAA